MHHSSSSKLPWESLQRKWRFPRAWKSIFHLLLKLPKGDLLQYFLCTSLSLEWKSDKDYTDTTWLILLFYMPHPQIHLFLHFSAIESLLIYSSLTDFDHFKAQWYHETDFPNRDPLSWECFFRAPTWKLKGVGVSLKNEVLHKPQFLGHPSPLQKVRYEPSRGGLLFPTSIIWTLPSRIVTSTLWPCDHISRSPC